MSTASMSRRAFLKRARAFAAAGATAASLFQMLKPNYAWAIQVQPDDKRIRTETVSVPSPKRKRKHQRVSRAAGQ